MAKWIASKRTPTGNYVKIIWHQQQAGVDPQGERQKEKKWKKTEHFRKRCTHSHSHILSERDQPILTNKHEEKCNDASKSNEERKKISST